MLIKLILLFICINIIYCKTAHLCQNIDNNSASTIIYKLDKNIGCENLQPMHSDINVDIYHYNDESYTSHSFKIIIKKYTCITSFSMFGGYTTIRREKYLKLTDDQYRSINKSLVYNVNDININLYQINDDVFQNKNPGYDCRYNIFSDNNIDNYEITLHRSVVTVTNGMMVSRLIPGYLCTYNNKNCTVNDEVLIWDIHSNYSIKYILYESNVSMILLKDSVTNRFHVLNEKYKTGYSILNTTDKVTDSSCLNCLYTENPYIVLNLDENILGKYAAKVKRSIPETNITTNTTTTKPSESTKSNLKNNVKDDQFNNIHFGILDTRYKHICKLIEMDYIYWKSMCIDNPISCAEKRLNITGINAKLTGDYLIIEKCMPIVIFRYKPRKIGNKCSALIPVVIGMNSTRVDAYFDIKTYMIYNNTIWFDADHGCNLYEIFEYDSELYIYYSEHEGIQKIRDTHDITAFNNINNIKPIDPRHVPSKILHGIPLHIISDDKSYTKDYIIIAIVILIITIFIVSYCKLKRY